MTAPQKQSTEHVHKLKRHTYETGNKIFFCALPDCKFKIKLGLALGKRSICWRCGEPFIMNEYSIRLAKPHCEDCHKSKNISQFEANVHNSDAVKTTIPIDLPLADRLKRATQIEDEDI